MNCEKELLSCEVAMNSPETSGEFRNSRISYTREFLLSMADFDACKVLPDGFDQSILSELAYSSTPEQQQLQGYNPHLSGGTSGSSRESAERWNTYKLSPKDSNSADSGRWTSNRSRHQSPNSGNTGNLRSSPQEHIGILGSWSGSKLSRDGSDESTSKLQGAKPSLLSRCSEPYRPPALKAISHSGERNHNSFNHETFRDGKDPSNKRATEERWRKDSFELAGDAQKADKEKQESSADRKEDSDPDALTPLPECVDGPEFMRNKAPIPMHLAESGSVEPSCPTHGAAAMYIQTESSSQSHLKDVQELPSESQTGQDSGGFCYEEKLQELLLEGSSFFALVDLEEAENIGPDFADKPKNIVTEGENFNSQSKFLHWFLDDEKESSNILSWYDKNGKKPWEEATGLMDENRLSKETSPCAQRAPVSEVRTPVSEVRKATVAEQRSTRPVGQKSCIPCGSSQDSRPSWEPQVDKSTRNQSLDSPSGASFHITQNSEPKSVPKCSPNADLNLEILLPDEDSLIKIDDTYIFQQDVRTPSPNITFKGGRSGSPLPSSNKLLKSGNLHHNLSFQDPWSLESQMNAQKLFVNPLDSRAHLNAPRTFQDPWKSYHYGQDPLAANHISHPFGQLSVEPQTYEPPVQHFRSPGVQQAERFYPHVHNAISPQPSIFHQPHQTPYRQPEPNPSRSPVNYPRNVNPTVEVGRRAVLGDEGNKSAFCHLLQMQMRMAQMNLEAASSSEERAYGTPIAYRFW